MSKNIKFPENLKIKEKLMRGDIIKLAEYSGMSEFTVIQTLKGYRRINDKIADAIIRLLAEREKRHQTLEQIANTL